MPGTAQTPDPDLILHGTTVAFGDRAVLIRGASGAGKSGLGLQLKRQDARRYQVYGTD